MKNDEVRKAVRKTYGKIAKQEKGCGCCCGGQATSEETSRDLGYSDDDVTSVPQGANMGLGCGNPQAIANLKEGETVVDLGSGGGFDCFLAARQVGENGHVIGIDMTSEMITKARENTERSGFKNVEFRLGEIEHLPVADNSVDAIISNCVINLSPEKSSVFSDAFRVLKSGGRLAITDVVALAELPDEVRRDMTLHSSCVAGALQIGQIKEMLKEAGFVEIRIEPLDKSKEIIREWIPGRKIEEYVLSATIEAVKP
ncbi:arsenite methyltransferase [Photobacterium sagamiensis]|uniref:arsenite methyltransferase n=1 Tax=Photobacterium sagamiensis TaxID=2910241 RepID=UPI003D0B6686